ncbi:MAG TPA: archease [Candidatus Omnitrophica bacterium]|nr:archease [Candidatus Omnitrophota bacterium]
MGSYRVIDHTADIGIFVEGKDLSDLFSTAGYAMFSQMIDLRLVGNKVQKKVELEGENLEDLLIRWLNELLYFSEKGYFFKNLKVKKIQNNFLSASIYGEKVDFEKIHLRQEIKAATYHQLEIKKSNNKWQATVIFDV